MTVEPQQPGLWPAAAVTGPVVSVIRGERAHRRVDPTLRPTGRIVSLFWSKVVKSPTCWYWTGAISDPDGYGRKRAELHRLRHSAGIGNPRQPAGADATQPSTYTSAQGMSSAKRGLLETHP